MASAEQKVIGQERETETWQNMEGFGQENHSENHKLMEERGTQHPGNPAEIRDGKKSIFASYSVGRQGSQKWSWDQE